MDRRRVGLVPGQRIACRSTRRGDRWQTRCRTTSTGNGWTRKDGGRFDVFDPATGEVIATAPDSKQADVDAAVSAARRTFDDGSWWPGTSARDRGRILLRAADVVRREQERLAAMESLDSGKPIGDAREDIAEVAFMFEYYGGWATKIEGDAHHVSADAMFMVWKEPMGVAVGITPWNYPLMMAVQKVAPALAAGCTFILKPPEQTPLTCLELPKILEEAGLPAGVLHVLTGFGETAGAPLVAHPGRGQGRIHRIQRGGQDHHALRRRHAEARHVGARRQVAEHRVRRRRPPGRVRGIRERGLLEPGRDLLGRHARLRRHEGLRRRRERVRRPGQGREARRGFGRVHDDGPARVEGAAGAGRALHRDRDGRSDARGQGREARRPAPRPGLLRAARRSSPTSRTMRRSRARRSSAR